MSKSEATSTSSPLNHFPPEQRGLLEFQKELNEMSGTTHHPINPETGVSEEAARNIDKIEEVMRSNSQLAPSVHGSGLVNRGVLSRRA